MLTYRGKQTTKEYDAHSGNKGRDYVLSSLPESSGERTIP